jgi:hypothetical protein
MLIVKAVLISFLLLYIYLFCIIRLVNYEFRVFIEFLRAFNKKWIEITGITVLFLFAPVIFVITVITKVLWKVTKFILK